MEIRKITAIFFILVLSLQLLPIRQVIQYFFNSTSSVEEFVTAGKAATKNFRLLDEDHSSLHGQDNISIQLNISNSNTHILFTEKLPAFYIFEILTPPPNNHVS